MLHDICLEHHYAYFPTFDNDPNAPDSRAACEGSTGAHLEPFLINQPGLTLLIIEEWRARESEWVKRVDEGNLAEAAERRERRTGRKKEEATNLSERETKSGYISAKKKQASHPVKGKLYIVFWIVVLKMGCCCADVFTRVTGYCTVCYYITLVAWQTWMFWKSRYFKHVMLYLRGFLHVL